jgi:hypothetical protein
LSIFLFCNPPFPLLRPFFFCSSSSSFYFHSLYSYHSAVLSAFPSLPFPSLPFPSLPFPSLPYKATSSPTSLRS